MSTLKLQTKSGHRSWKAIAYATSSFGHQPLEAKASNGSFSHAKMKKRISHKHSLDLFLDLNDAPPQKLAAQGNLDGLKACIESFGLTLKETDKNGCTLLHHATCHDQLVVMEYLIESGANLDAVETDGNTALHIAVQREFIDAMNLLLKSGASDAILNKQLDAPLHIIARMTNKELLSAFLQYDVEFMIPGYHKRTPLHVIAEHDNIECCKIVHNNASGKELRLCATDADGLTPTHLAARKGSHRVLTFMLDISRMHGYPSETVMSFLDEENSTPLHAAVDGGHLQVVKVFLEYGASPLVSRGDLIPALHLACSQGKIDMVKAMVEARGCEILSELDQYQRSPLHYSALSIKGACIISYIIEQVANLELDVPDTTGITPLHLAVVSGNLDCVQMLLAKKASPLVQCSLGYNALHCAVTCNRKSILNVLVDHQYAVETLMARTEKGDSPIHLALKLRLAHLVSDMVAVIRSELQNVKDAQGNNYLHLAAESGDWKAHRILFDIPACLTLLNETNKCGGTPLHMAAKGGHTHCIEVLLGQGAMVHRCHRGVTPFMDACRNGHAACAKILYTAHPFQVDWTDHAGNTALHYAAKSGDPNTVKEALDMGCKITHNNDLESFLDVIISSSSKDCAMAVVNHSRWQECLDFQSPLSLHPMIGLIVNMPDVAKSVLDRCHTESKLNAAHHDYWEEFNFKYLQLDTRPRISPPMDEETSTDRDDLNLTDVQPRSIRYKGSIAARDTPVKYQQNQAKAPQSMVALRKMMQYRRANLLIHPVVNAYLKQKWDKYGRKINLAIYLLHILLVVLLSTFILIVPNPDINSSGNASSALNESVSSQNGLTPGAQVIRAIVLFLNTLVFLQLLVLLFKNGYSSLNSLSIWTHATTIVLNYIFLLAPNPLLLWEVGSLACFSSCFLVFLGLALFNVVGIYIKMFLRIVRTVIKVLVVCSLLLFAFAVVFYMLAGSITQFSTIGYSYFSMFGYMMGEIEYDLFIVKDSMGQLRHGYYVLIVVIVVAILMSIVMANLLIGLAVGDIESIKLNAVLEQKELEIDYFTFTDFFIPKRYNSRWNVCSLKVHPNCSTSRLQRAWQTVRKSVKVSSFKADTNFSAGSVTEELMELKKQLAELTDTIKLIQEQNCDRSTPRRLGSQQSLATIDEF